MPDTKTAQTRFSNPFSALRHVNFRYYFIGMCVSTIGTWMQNIAQPWLAYKLTNSPFLLSLIGALQFTPVLLFSLFAGVIIDRFPKKNILIFTQSASMLITLTLAILAWSGQIRYWQIAVMATLLGFVNTLDMPTRHSFAIEMVGKEDLMGAIAMNSMVFNVARIIGPTIAGIVMAAAGVPICFLVNAISFGAVLISLFFIHPEHVIQVTKRQENIFATIGQGLKYVLRHQAVLVAILVVAVVGTFAPNFSVLVPVFSTKILGQQELGYGVLMSCMGAGSLCGAIFVAALSRSGPSRFLMFIVPLIVGVFLILVGATGTFWLTGLALAVTGFFFVSFSSNANSTVQLNTSDEYRGRVMSVYTLVFSGSTPIGNLYAGAVTQHFNARVGFYACGGIILLLMIPVYLYLMRQKSREVL